VDEDWGGVSVVWRKDGSCAGSCRRSALICDSLSPLSKHGRSASLPAGSGNCVLCRLSGFPAPSLCAPTLS